MWGWLESLHLKMVDTDVSLFFSFSILTIMYSCLSYPLRTDTWGENPRRFAFGQCGKPPRGCRYLSLG